MFFRKITLLGLLLVSFFLNETNLRSNNVPNTPITPPVCDIPAPATFNVTEIGTDYVALQWSASSPQPAFYRIKTYVAATNSQVSNVVVPGWMTMARISNLTPGETYYSRINPVCGENNESTSSKESGNFTTIIGEIIVSGYQGTNSNIVDCSPSPTCSLTNNVLHEFRVIKKSDQTSRRFGVIYSDGVFETHLSNNGNSGEAFALYCETSISPACDNASKITIKNGNTVVGSYSIYAVTAANPQPFLKVSNLNQNYTIDLMAPGALLKGDDAAPASPAFGKQQQLHLGISPMPFTDHLDVRLPADDNTGTAQITLYDAQGKLIQTVNDAAAGQTHTLQTPTLRPGIYFIRVELAEHTEVHKVIKTE